MPKQLNQNITIDLYKLVSNSSSDTEILSAEELSTLIDNLEVVIAELITDKNIVVEVKQD